MARPLGFGIRDAFEEVVKGQSKRCRDCGKSGVIGDTMHIVFSEYDSPYGREYSVKGLCNDCEKKVATRAGHP